MTTDKSPDLVIIDEVHSLVEADFAEIEKRVLAGHIEEKTLHGGESREKLSDYVHPLIADAYRVQAMHYLGMDLGTEFHPTGRPKFKAPEPIKRAKTKAARKQRRKQK